MKYLLIALACFFIKANSFAQNADSSYASIMTAYNQHDYSKASTGFKSLFKQLGYKLSSNALYDGACIYALNGESDSAMEILTYLVNQKYYSDVNHIKNDKDLEKLRDMPAWAQLISKVESNQQTLPARTREKVKREFLKAKALLQQDNGKLWGETLRPDDLLALSADNTIYSMLPLPGSTTTDSVIYTKKIADGVLSQTNSAQRYEGKFYAVVLANYLADSSATIIHELFHTLQYRHIHLNGNPVSYLDEYQAREWLRLEYQALKNALQAVRDKKSKADVAQYVTNALMYRKLRQMPNQQSLNAELQIETSEGLANYTGFVLSTLPDKYLTAIREINMRESAATYTRPFPYATGPAYGMLFDYLQMNWKAGLGKTYNFLQIYETIYLHHQVSVTPGAIALANGRNNFNTIHNQELLRKKEFDQKISFYTDLFEHQPTLTAKLKDTIYSRSYDMNGTVVLKDKGMIYTNITGTDITGKEFGSFKAKSGGDPKSPFGIMGDFDAKVFTFPLPIKINGDKITGNGFEIQLNKGWVIRQKNKKGDLEIVQQ